MFLRQRWSFMSSVTPAVNITDYSYQTLSKCKSHLFNLNSSITQGDGFDEE